MKASLSSLTRVVAVFWPRPRHRFPGPKHARYVRTGLGISRCSARRRRLHASASPRTYAAPPRLYHQSNIVARRRCAASKTTPVTRIDPSSPGRGPRRRPEEAWRGPSSARRRERETAAVAVSIRVGVQHRGAAHTEAGAHTEEGPGREVRKIRVQL